MKHRASLAALFAVAILTTAALADSDDDHERARRAFEAGEIVSLTKIIERVERDFEGEVLEVELEDEGRHGLVYEVKLLTPKGEIVELLFDAGDGGLLRIEGGDNAHEERSEHDEVEDYD
jgi:uncharacterized membrane protein YkoI